MSSPFTSWPAFTIASGISILLTFVAAEVAVLLLRRLTNRLVRPASSQTRGAQAREQQSRTMAEQIYRVASGFVWAAAILSVLAELGVNVLPAVIVIGAAIVAIGIGARSMVEDVAAGLAIVFEDQFAVGETIQVGDTAGKVEQLTLRRTVLRDARGALVTLGNGEIRSVANVSRDWSAATVDIAVAAEEPLERALQILETASSGLRADLAWSQAIVDGPRVLGVQEFGRAGATLRVQVRTTPLRQDEIARELRRRIQMEFQRHRIEITTTDEIDQASIFDVREEAPGSKISGLSKK
ncbi:MAG TPA: mechanosensitive ion channel domain-containing protein [Candidatus Acidoferrum sp.]